MKDKVQVYEDNIVNKIINHVGYCSQNPDCHFIGMLSFIPIYSHMSKHTPSHIQKPQLTVVTLYLIFNRITMLKNHCDHYVLIKYKTQKLLLFTFFSLLHTISLSYRSRQKSSISNTVVNLEIIPTSHHTLNLISKL